MNGQLHTATALFQGKISLGTYWREDCVISRAGLDALKKSRYFNIPGIEFRPIARATRIYTNWAIQALSPISLTLVLPSRPFCCTDIDGLTSDSSTRLVQIIPFSLFHPSFRKYRLLTDRLMLVSRHDGRASVRMMSTTL
jgi:hypothetical protein